MFIFWLLINRITEFIIIGVNIFKVLKNPVFLNFGAAIVLFNVWTTTMFRIKVKDFFKWFNESSIAKIPVVLKMHSLNWFSKGKVNVTTSWKIWARYWFENKFSIVSFFDSQNFMVNNSIISVHDSKEFKLC